MSFPDPPTIEDLECLISWPKNTLGYRQEQTAIQILHQLMKSQGFGRIHQIVNEIEDIWRDPSKSRKKIKQFAKQRDKFVKSVMDARKEIGE